MPGSGPFPYLTAVTDTLLAVQDPSEPIPTCRIRPYSERSVWYRFTPEQSAFYSISTIGGPGGTATTIYDTTLAAYTSSNGCAGPFVPFACNDDIAPGREFRSEIKTNFSAGTTYYITVCDTEPEPAVTETDVQLRVTIPPEAITLPASSVTSVGAVVNGLVRLNGLRTFFWFEWGTNTTSNITYNLPRSAVRLLIPPATEVNTNATFAGILPNVLYHYRLVATNTNGRAEGDDRTFLWSTASPTLQAYTIPVTGGSFQFEFNGSPGQLYRAQSSTNLADWVDLGSATEVGPVGQGTNRFRFIDLRLPVPPSRFYRIWAP